MTRLAELERLTKSFGSTVVAFSGGVDSSLVACVAARTLGANALAVTAVSPALATGELAGAREVARAIGIAHEVISTEELARPAYAANGRDRCYHCKSELYDRLAELACARGFATVVSGANLDDLGDWRPGLTAAHEHGVHHPLVEVGIGKAEVRALAVGLGLPNADKPASPCLASRLPYGTPVTPEILARVDQAEHALKQLGYRVLRVRHYGSTARVQVGAPELARAVTPQGHAEIAAVLRAAGYRRIVVDRKPFVSGSLNTFRSP